MAQTLIRTLLGKNWLFLIGIIYKNRQNRVPKFVYSQFFSTGDLSTVANRYKFNNSLPVASTFAMKLVVIVYTYYLK